MIRTRIWQSLNRWQQQEPPWVIVIYQDGEAIGREYRDTEVDAYLFAAQATGIFDRELLREGVSRHAIVETSAGREGQNANSN